MLSLVESYDDVVLNSKEFYDNIENGLVRKLCFFRHWYYIEETDTFAPSKFIGYKGITISEYRRGTIRNAGYMDGRDTVNHLKQWFRLADDKEYEISIKKIRKFLAKYGKRPNANIFVHYKKQL